MICPRCDVAYVLDVGPDESDADVVHRLTLSLEVRLRCATCGTETRLDPLDVREVRRAVAAVNGRST